MYFPHLTDEEAEARRTAAPGPSARGRIWTQIHPAPNLNRQKVINTIIVRVRSFLGFSFINWGSVPLLLSTPPLRPVDKSAHEEMRSSILRAMWTRWFLCVFFLQLPCRTGISLSGFPHDQPYVTMGDVMGLCLWLPVWGIKKRELNNGGTKTKATVRAGSSNVSLGPLECANPLPSRMVPPSHFIEI